MESLTKNKQTYDSIVEMVSKAFNNSGVIDVKELKEGYFNAAYLIKISDGQEVILKIAPAQNATVMTYEKDIMFTEVETMKLVGEVTNVPVPGVLYYDNSHILCEADYFFMTKLEGESYESIKNTLNEEQKNAIDYQLGELNAQINLIQGTKFGYYGQPQKQDTNWYQTFSSILNDILSDGEVMNVDIGIGYDVIRQLLKKHQKAFDEVTVPYLVHWDLWAGNVFVKNGKIVGIIDFERGLWADKFMEYGFRSNNFNENFYKGYRIEGLSEMEKIRINWYDVYLHLVMTIECKYRHYENDDSYNWSKNNLTHSLETL